MKWKRWLLCTGVFLVIGVVGYSVARTPNYDALKAEGNSLVQQIAAHRTAYGEYPRSLGGAHIKAPLTSFGYWHYDHTTSNSYWLYVGDYGRDGFRLRYIPDHGWDLDD